MIKRMAMKLLDRIKELLSSKKVQSTIASILTQVFQEKLGISPDEANKISYALIAYTLGQGAADAGKEKAKLEMKRNGSN